MPLRWCGIVSPTDAVPILSSPDSNGRFLTFDVRSATKAYWQGLFHDSWRDSEGVGPIWGGSPCQLIGDVGYLLSHIGFPRALSCLYPAIFSFHYFKREKLCIIFYQGKLVLIVLQMLNIYENPQRYILTMYLGFLYSPYIPQPQYRESQN